MKIIRRRSLALTEANASAERRYLARKRAGEVSQDRYVALLRKDREAAIRLIQDELIPSMDWTRTGTGMA